MASSGSTGGGTPVTLVIPVPPPTGTPTVVVTPRPHLPFTGFDLSTALVLTALLLALGVALVVTGRRPGPYPRRI